MSGAKLLRFTSENGGDLWVNPDFVVLVMPEFHVDPPGRSAGAKILMVGDNDIWVVKEDVATVLKKIGEGSS